MSITEAERREIMTPSLKERIRRGLIDFEGAKREQEQNYGIAIRHIEVPGDPEGEEWEVKIGDRILSFAGVDAKEKMKKWTEKNNGVVVFIEKSTQKIKVLAGELVDDTFLQKVVEDEAMADSSSGGGD